MFQKGSKNIAICPEVEISHLGIVKTHENSKSTLNNEEHLKNHLIFFAAFWPLLDAVLGPLFYLDTVAPVFPNQMKSDSPANPAWFFERQFRMRQLCGPK